MNKTFSLAIVVYLMISVIFFKKIIQTDAGLISYFVISIGMLLYLFFSARKKKTLD
jgi:hypothetical protein